MRSLVMNKRTNHISRVHRKVSTNPMPLIHTIDGPAHIMILKHCQSCTMQPLDNFYFISKSKMKKYGYHENDVRSRENICITCWDKNNEGK